MLFVSMMHGRTNVRLQLLGGCSAAGARAATSFSFVSLANAAARSASKRDKVAFLFKPPP
jgi:hypothetical protein